jgi:SAM-dependent methyltransferase
MIISDSNRFLKAIKDQKSVVLIILLKLEIFNKIIRITDYVFDYSRNINTSNTVANADLDAIDPISQSHATHYAPYPIFMLWMLKRTLMNYNSYHFIDIGCGNGRVCFYATKIFSKVTGIDFSPRLIDEAKHNLEGFNKYYPKEINFILIDARGYLLPDEKCVIFMFNPFDDIILKDFLLINEHHFRDHKSVIIYANPQCADTLISLGFDQIFEIQGVRGYLIR